MRGMSSLAHGGFWLDDEVERCTLASSLSLLPPLPTPGMHMHLLAPGGVPFTVYWPTNHPAGAVFLRL